MARGKRMAVKTYDPIGSYLVVALIYLVMVFGLDTILKFIERKTRIPGFDAEVKKA